MKATATTAGVTLRLSVDEALKLEALLGCLSGPPARSVPWYDSIANALEDETHNHLGGRTISAALYDAEVEGTVPQYPLEAAYALCGFARYETAQKVR